MDLNKIKLEIKNIGFTDVGVISVNDIEFIPEVREMCKQNRCGAYGKKWSCPPFCGELSECEQKVTTYSKGLVMMTATALEDSFDFEGMTAAQKVHNGLFLKAKDYIEKNITKDILPLAPGGCNMCEECSCPDSPCRFPDKMFPSMEAYGMLVNTVCEKANVSYFNGTGTVTYVSCIFLK